MELYWLHEEQNQIILISRLACWLISRLLTHFLDPKLPIKDLKLLTLDPYMPILDPDQISVVSSLLVYLFDSFDVLFDDEMPEVSLINPISSILFKDSIKYCPIYANKITKA